MYNVFSDCIINSCADPESFARGQHFFFFFFFWGGGGGSGREDPNTTKRGPPSVRQRNAIWRADDGPTLNAWMLSSLFIAALWSPEGKGLLALVCDVYCDFVTFPFSILGQVWYLIVSIPDPCCLSYFESFVISLGIRTSIAKPYSFVIFQGVRTPAPHPLDPSMRFKHTT